MAKDDYVNGDYESVNDSNRIADRQSIDMKNAGRA